MTFPTSPSNGEIYISASGVVFEYDSSVGWKRKELSAARFHTKLVESPAGDGSDDGKYVKWDLQLDQFVLDDTTPVSPLLGSPMGNLGALAAHALVIDGDGSIWSWGMNNENSNDYGTLGDGTATNRSSPVSVLRGFSYVKATTCAFNSYAIRGDGTAWGWGNGATIGHGSSTRESSPVSVLGGRSYIDIVGGELSHVLALEENGQVWGWGANARGCLGINAPYANYNSPVSMHGNHSFVMMATARYVSYMLKSNGEVWACGENEWGQLGVNNSVDYSTPVSVLGNHSFVEIAGGDEFILARKHNGTVYAWGRNSSRELAQGSGDNQPRSSPISIAFAHSFTQVACGGQHAIALKEDGSAWCWGTNLYGECGQGTSTGVIASPVSVLGGHSFVQVQANEHCSFGAKANGEVYAWGRNELATGPGNCRIGIAQGVTEKTTPTKVAKTFSYVVL